MFRWLVALFGALALASGCVPNLKENRAREVRKEVPDRFRDTGPSAEAAVAAQNVGLKTYREFFSNPELQKLIDEAIRNNQELNLRIQEIIIASAEAAARRGEYGPRVGIGVGAGVDRPGAFTSQGRSDEHLDLPKNLGNFEFGLRAQWELDVWGKLRNSARAAQLRFLSSVEGKNFVLTQVVAEIARSYFELIALDNQIDVLNRNIGIQTDALEVMRVEKASARVTQLAVLRFEAEVLKNRSRLYTLEQSRVQIENRINFLVGRFPRPIQRNSQELKDPLPSVIQSGLPSQLLTNRPDVRAAELELEAAKLDVSAARKAFYPSLSIDAAAGFRSFSASHLLDTPESLVYNLAGSLMAPLLNRAGIAAQYRSANARQIQAVVGYERTLLQAFTDVVNHIVRFENIQRGYGLQLQQVDTLAKSVEVSNVLFQSARADYMEVLLTRRDSLEAQMELIETKKNLLQTMVDIYQSLGGGWRPAS